MSNHAARSTSGKRWRRPERGGHSISNGVLVTAAWSGFLTLVLLKVTNLVSPLRVSAEEETEGLDTALHGEKGYNL